MLHAADEENGADQQEDQPTVLQHDDDIGEEVPCEQMQMICECIVRLVCPILAFVLMGPATLSPVMDPAASLTRYWRLHKCYLVSCFSSVY